MNLIYKFTADSTNICEIKYFDNLILEIHYIKDGNIAIYHYFNVENSIASKIYQIHLKHESVGKFVHYEIKPNYKYSKVNESLENKTSIGKELIENVENPTKPIKKTEEEIKKSKSEYKKVIKNRQKDNFNKLSEEIKTDNSVEEIKENNRQNNLHFLQENETIFDLKFKIQQLEEENKKLKDGIITVKPELFSKMNKAELLQKIREYYYYFDNYLSKKIIKDKLEYNSLYQAITNLLKLLKNNNMSFSYANCTNETLFITTDEDIKDSTDILMNDLQLKEIIIKRLNSLHYSDERHRDLKIHPLAIIRILEDFKNYMIINCKEL